MQISRVNRKMGYWMCFICLTPGSNLYYNFIFSVLNCATTQLTVWFTGGRRRVGCQPPIPGPISFFQSFGKKIYSKRLKLSVAVYSSSATFWICQLCVNEFSRCHGRYKFQVGLTKILLFFDIIIYFFSFLHRISEIRKFLHAISILAWFFVNFCYFLTF